MSDRTELLLRDLLAEDAEHAPTHGDLARGARLRLRRRRTTTAGGALAVVAALAATATLVLPDRDRATVAANDDRPFVGTTWQMVAYSRDGLRVEVPGEADTSLSLSAEGTYYARVCNHLGGKARVEGGRVTLFSSFRTERLCGPPLNGAEEAFQALTDDDVAWDVDGETLRIESPDGAYLLFRVRPTIWGDSSARTLVEGNYEGSLYRVAEAGRILHLEVGRGPGYGWSSSSMARDGEPVMSWALRAPVGRGSAQLVAGYATADTVRATHESPDGTVTTLALVDAGAGKAFHGIVPRNPYRSLLRLWRADGSLVAQFEEHREDG